MIGKVRLRGRLAAAVLVGACLSTACGDGEEVQAFCGHAETLMSLRGQVIETTAQARDYFSRTRQALGDAEATAPDELEDELATLREAVERTEARYREVDYDPERAFVTRVRPGETPTFGDEDLIPRREQAWQAIESYVEDDCA